MTILTLPQGELTLLRYPVQKNDPLQAWDAADEYLLHAFWQHVSEQHLSESTSLLLVNDSFGALATALAKYPRTMWTDSWLAIQACKNNLGLNACNENNIEFADSLALPDKADMVLFKVPKSLALLEDQLARIAAQLRPSTWFVAAGMARNIHRSTLALFEKYLGTTTTSLAKKKARLICVKIAGNMQAVSSPYPKQYYLQEYDFHISNHANVFSREKLDVGTRFFLQYLPQSQHYQHIIDLGCGNGIVGLLAARKNPQATVSFYDESFMAIASAKANIKQNLPDFNKAQFFVNDALQGVAADSADLVLLNPPFHQQHAVHGNIARRMFSQAKNVLVTGGELWVIGNRHLGYHIQLKRLLRNCEVVAANKKFVILRALKQ